MTQHRSPARRPGNLRQGAHRFHLSGMGQARLRCAAASARHRPSTSSPRCNWRMRTGQTTPASCPHRTHPIGGAAAHISPSGDMTRCRQAPAWGAKRQPRIDRLTPIQRKRAQAALMVCNGSAPAPTGRSNTLRPGDGRSVSKLTPHQQAGANRENRGRKRHG